MTYTAIGRLKWNNTCESASQRVWKTTGAQWITWVFSPSFSFMYLNIIISKTNIYIYIYQICMITRNVQEITDEDKMPCKMKNSQLMENISTIKY